MEHFSNAASVHDINVEDQPIGLLGYGLNEALNLLAVFRNQLLRLLVPLLIASVHVETLLTKLRQGQRHGFGNAAHEHASVLPIPAGVGELNDDGDGEGERTEENKSESKRRKRRQVMSRVLFSGAAAATSVAMLASRAKPEMPLRLANGAARSGGAGRGGAI